MHSKASFIKFAVTLTLLLVSCKENSAPASKEKKDKSDDSTTSSSPSPSPDPEPVDTSTDTGTDPCTTSDYEDGDTETETDTSSEDSEDPFSLTGQTLTKKVAAKGKSHKVVKHKKKKKAKSAKPKVVAAKATGKGFSLTESVSYDSDIRSILESKCTTCHTSSGTPPDLTSYSLAKSALSSSISQIDSDKMPTASPLSSSEKEKFHAWQDAGAPESSSDSSGDESSDDSTDTSTDCGSSSGEDDEFTDGYDDLVNPPELEECKDKGKIFDRKAGECHKAEIADFGCEHSGIVAAFKKVGVSAESKLSSIEGDGYQIDQCGIYDGEPIIYFTKQGDSSGDTVSLKIKKLCKPTASVCQ